MAPCRVCEVVFFVDDWLDRHMASDAQDDVVSPREYIPYEQISLQFVRQRIRECRQRPVNPPPNLQSPLHYQCVKTINDRPYFLQLQKRPGDFVVLSFTAMCLHDSNQPDIIIDGGTYFDQSGYHDAVLEITEDRQYVISLRTRRR